jgi:cytochrome c biogenesis protein CcmG, thiol:disulfide interchange protein DsbE
MRRWRVPIALLTLLVVGLVVAEVLSGSADKRPRRAAPDLPTAVLSGKPVTLADLRGKPTIVHFWASWCGPCIKEAPELAALPAILGGRANVVGVDWSDSHSHAVAFVRKHGWRFPILEDRDGKVGNRYQLAGLPTTFLLDSNGRIVKQLTGPQTTRNLTQRVSELERA